VEFPGDFCTGQSFVRLPEYWLLGQGGEIGVEGARATVRAVEWSGPLDEREEDLRSVELGSGTCSAEEGQMKPCRLEKLGDRRLAATSFA